MFKIEKVYIFYILPILLKFSEVVKRLKNLNQYFNQIALQNSFLYFCFLQILVLKLKQIW